MAADDHEHCAVRDLILQLKRTPGVTVEDQADCWRLSISKPADLIFEVIVPHDVLEWFVTVRREGAELWSDWMDYYAIDAHPSKDLDSAMANDIEYFVKTLASRTVRVVESRSFLSKRNNIQWLSEGTWRKMSLSEPTH